MNGGIIQKNIYISIVRHSYQDCNEQKRDDIAHHIKYFKPVTKKILEDTAETVLSPFKQLFCLYYGR